MCTTCKTVMPFWCIRRFLSQDKLGQYKLTGVQVQRRASISIRGGGGANTPVFCCVFPQPLLLAATYSVFSCNLLNPNRSGTQPLFVEPPQFRYRLGSRPELAGLYIRVKIYSQCTYGTTCPCHKLCSRASKQWATTSTA